MLPTLFLLVFRGATPPVPVLAGSSEKCSEGEGLMKVAMFIYVEDGVATSVEELLGIKRLAVTEGKPEIGLRLLRGLDKVPDSMYPPR